MYHLDWTRRLARRFRQRHVKNSGKRPGGRRLGVEVLEPRVVLAITTPVVTELMAVNDATIADGEIN